MIRSFLAVILLTMTTVGGNFAQNQEAFLYINEKEVLLSSAQAQVLAKAKEEKALASYQLFRFNNLGSLKEQTSFNISLPEKASLHVERKRFEAKKTNEWTLSGAFDSSGSIFLSATNGDVTGVIQIGRELYWLQPLGNGLHILIKVDPKKIPRDEPEDWNPMPDTTQTNQSKSGEQIESEKNGLAKTTTSTPVIDILVAYTPAVAAHSGNITSLVNACIQSTNESFANSNMTSNVQVALTQAVQVSYTESGDVVTDKDRLLATNDGYMDNIFALRDQYHADLVVLLVDFDNGGLAGVAAGIGVGASSAYAVVVDNYAVGNYTFAHEIGHLIGARHDNDPNDSPRAYAHGYRYNPAYWRTIMAVYDDVVLRINYWSSPLNTYGGVAMGTTNWNDARRVWNECAGTVEAFRSRGLEVEGLSGPGFLQFKQQGTWHPVIISGSGSYSYQWYVSTDGGSTWTTLGTAYTQSRTMVTYDFIMRCDVHDNGTGENASGQLTVYYGTPPPKVGSDEKEIAALAQEIPTEYSLFQNYPNPFNPSTEIRFALPEQAHVKLAIFDMLGREVAQLVNGQMDAGYHSVTWNANTLPSGVYIYRLAAGSFVQTKKLVLAK